MLGNKSTVKSQVRTFSFTVLAVFILSQALILASNISDDYNTNIENLPNVPEITDSSSQNTPQDTSSEIISSETEEDSSGSEIQSEIEKPPPSFTQNSTPEETDGDVNETPEEETPQETSENFTQPEPFPEEINETQEEEATISEEIPQENITEPQEPQNITEEIEPQENITENVTQTQKPIENITEPEAPKEPPSTGPSTAFTEPTIELFYPEKIIRGEEIPISAKITAFSPIKDLLLTWNLPTGFSKLSEDNTCPSSLGNDYCWYNITVLTSDSDIGEKNFGVVLSYGR